MQAGEVGLIVIRILVALLGMLIVSGTLIAAIKTFVLPRGINVWLTRIIFRGVGAFFRFRAGRASSYKELDNIMALYAPVTLFLMPIAILTLVLLGYVCLYWAVEIRPLPELFKLSGSSLLTLGYASADNVISKLLEFSEAMIGLILVALLIAYLPTMYSAFAKRETNVALLEGRAGSPPSAVELIARSHRTGELENMRDMWISWQIWFAEVEESHTSLAALAFFRSPQSERSWVTAAGTVLDSAALMLSTVDVPWVPQAAFCIRSGYLALREVANYFGISHNANPTLDDPISVSRSEYDAVYDELQWRDIPLKANREQAWHDFLGWRVNYDTVLLALAELIMAPYAPWSSDRCAVKPEMPSLLAMPDS
jgi:hypothetical protein